MAAILRWFEVEGHRHRAYFRQAATGAQELVIAGPGHNVSAVQVPVLSLDEFSETELIELAKRVHPGCDAV